MSEESSKSCASAVHRPSRVRCAAAFGVLLIAILGSASSLLAQEIQRRGESQRHVQGTVVDSATDRPIAGVTVAVEGTDARTYTDSSGHYEIAGFLPAAIVLIVRQIGYAPVKLRVDLSRGASTANVALPARAVVLEGMTAEADTVARFLSREQATSTMSASEVERSRGQTLGETIKDLPGVSVIQYGPSIAKPVVRGLHSQRIATINSGVPQEGQQWGGEHAPEIDAFAANEIEVIRGPGTILYGSGALGGVVRVMPRPLPTSGGIGGSLSLNAFANNRQGAASLLLEGADIHLPILGPLGWRAQVSGRRAGDARTPDYYLPNTGFDELDYDLAVGFTRPWGRSELDYSHFGTRLGMYAGAHVGNLDDLERAMQQPYTSPEFSYDIAHPDQKVSHNLLAWHTSIGLPRSAELEVSYGYQHNDRQEFDSHGFAAFGGRPAFGLDLYTHTLDVKYHHPSLGRVSGTVGVSGMRQGNLSPGRSFLIPQYRLYTGGVFALEQIDLAPLTVTAGARFDYRWQHSYQYGEPVVVSPDDRRSYEGVSGSLGASYQLTPAWSVAATVGRAWRPPNVNELFSQGVHHGTAQYEIGDSSLTAEVSLNADVTLRHAGARTRLEVSAFRNQIDGFIYLRPRAPVSTVRGAYPAYDYAHVDALLRGAEVTGQLAAANWLSLYANVNVVRGTDRHTGQPLYDMPADRLTASARLLAPGNSWATGPYFEIGTTLVRKQDRVPAVTIYKLPTAGYGLLNLELGASAIELRGVRLEPSIAVRNVLDTRYRDYLSRYRLFVNEPGRDVVLRVTMPFGPAR